ncbi:hypothetical protein J4418_05125 [Candidatus Woesearchaeota archaeon]|nr:hypothetical protein [Candidatus Woesearchaeota archaeon]
MKVNIITEKFRMILENSDNVVLFNVLVLFNSFKYGMDRVILGSNRLIIESDTPLFDIEIQKHLKNVIIPFCVELGCAINQQSIGISAVGHLSVSMHATKTQIKMMTNSGIVDIIELIGEERGKDDGKLVQFQVQ